MSTTPPPPHRPPVVRALNAAGRLAARWGLSRPSLDVDSLYEAAARRTGLSDFGGDDHREGLVRLVRSIESEAKTNLLGRISAHTQIVDLLATRLELTAHRASHPELAHERVEKPLFVLGLPRTGTTLLYELLACDASSRSPTSWELARPCPPPEPSTYATDPRIAPIAANLRQFKKMVPTLDAIHPIGAALPQECVVITAPSFRSFQFQLSFDIPSYQDWYMSTDIAPAYRFHRRFLEHLQSQFRGARWVLKSPAHLGHLEALLAEYPDARIVQTHRDPLDVIPSVSSLHHAVRGFGSDDVVPSVVGAQQSAIWSEFLDRAMAARARLDPSRFLDVRFEDVLVDPIAVVKRIYAHFDLELTSAAEAAMRRHLAAHPREKHGRHVYTLGMFGLTEAGIRRDFGAYRAHLGFDTNDVRGSRP